MIAAIAVVAILTLAALPTVSNAASGTDFYNQGVAAAKAGNYTGASHDFENALLHGHSDPGTFYQLGLSYHKIRSLNFAAWAVATALSDPVFAALNPQASKELDSIQNAGGANAGPPALLQNVAVTAMKAPPLTAQQRASRESGAAFGALQQGAYFASPEYAKAMNLAAQSALSQAARDIHDNSNTIAKFVFLGATPSPYTNLNTYAHDLLTHLNLQQSVVVVVTPGGVAAASDRLDSAASGSISAAQLQSHGTGDAAALAVAVARAVVRQADDNDSATTRRAVLIGGAIGLIVLAVLATAVVRVARREPKAAMPRSRANGRIATRTRSR